MQSARDAARWAKGGRLHVEMDAIGEVSWPINYRVEIEFWLGGVRVNKDIQLDFMALNKILIAHIKKNPNFSDRI